MEPSVLMGCRKACEGNIGPCWLIAVLVMRRDDRGVAGEREIEGWYLSAISTYDFER
jgi:hypothetical protein